VASGLRDRVAGGVIDEAFVEAARGVARKLTGSRPGPSSSPRGWSADDIDDLIHDAVVKVGPDRIVLAANAASNDVEFREWLSTTVRSVLDSRAGRTPTGRVIRAMDDASREEPGRFVLTRGYWALTNDDRSASWREGRAPLVRLAWTIPTTTVQISAGAAKTPPMAYRRDIRAVAAAVLELAGPLRKVDLAEVLAERFNALLAARFDYLDLDTDEDAPPGPGTPDIAGSTADDDAARWMLGQLTADERRALGVLAAPGGSIRQLMAHLGCTKYRAELIHRRLTEKVRRLAELSHDDDHAATARLLEILGHHDDLRRSLDQDEPRDVA